MDGRGCETPLLCPTANQPVVGFMFWAIRRLKKAKESDDGAS